jgi:hypothetical protein
MLLVVTVWCDAVGPRIRAQDGRQSGVVVEATVVVGSHSRSGDSRRVLEPCCELNRLGWRVTNHRTSINSARYYLR